jgi:hypothetical protein
MTASVTASHPQSDEVSPDDVFVSLHPILDGGPHQYLLLLRQPVGSHRATVDVGQSACIQAEVGEVVLVAVYGANTLIVT